MLIDTSLTSFSFLHYPELRKTVDAAVKHPEKKLNISFNTLYDKDANVITFIFRAILHGLSLLLSAKYRTDFRRAIAKIEKIIDHETIRTSSATRNRIRRVLSVWKDSAKAKKSLRKLLAGIQRRKDIEVQLQNKIEIATKAHEEFKAKLEETIPSLEKELDKARKELLDLTTPLKDLKARFIKLFGDNSSDVIRKEAISAVQAKVDTLFSQLEFAKKEFKNIKEQKIEVLHPEVQKDLRDLAINTRELHILQRRLDSIRGTAEPSAEVIQIHPPVVTLRDEFLGLLRQEINEEMCGLWKVFFDKFEAAAISSFNFDKSTKRFKIVLSESLKLWIPKLQADDPDSGSILIFGKDKVVEGQFDAPNKSIKFVEGFYIHCRIKMGFIPLVVTPQVFSFTYHSRHKVSMGAGMMGTVQERSKSLDEYLNGWDKHSVVVTGPAEAFLQK